MPSQFNRRHFLQLGVLGTTALSAQRLLLSLRAADEGELLYNGIRLPLVWPPKIKDVPAEPITPVYLTSPPAVIPIDVGRQLFVDDFLIEKTTLTHIIDRRTTPRIQC